MSQGGSRKVRIEELNKQIDAELKEWHKEGIDPSGWRMGGMEFLIRCENIAISKLLMEKFDMEQEDMDVYLKEVVLEQMKMLRPQAIEQKSKAMKEQILRGVIRPQI